MLAKRNESSLQQEMSIVTTLLTDHYLFPESGVTQWNFHHLKVLRMYVLVKDMPPPSPRLPDSTFGFISFHQGGLKCLKLPLYSPLPSPSFTSKVPPWLWTFFFLFIFFNYSLSALCIANERLKGIFLWKALLRYVYFIYLFFNNAATSFWSGILIHRLGLSVLLWAV